jgi:uncharacterized protein (TIGR02271 family)
MISLNHKKMFRRLMAVSMAGSLFAGCSTGHRGGGGYYTSSTTSTTRGYSNQTSDYSASSENTEQNNQNSQNEISGQSTTVIPLFKEEVHVGKRTVDAGSVRLQKSVKTETINQPIELRQETVTVQRQDANGQSQPMQGIAANEQRLNQPFQEGQIEIRLQREEPVVEKQIVPAGSVIVQKSARQQQQNVRSDIRRDDITAQKSGDSQDIKISGIESSDMQGGAAMGGTADSSAQFSGGASSDTITDINSLSPERASQCDGKSVRLSGVQVQQSLGDRLVALRGSERPIYVQLRQPQSLRPGQTVTVSGTVKVRSQTSSQSDLDQQAQQALQGQPFYIEAQNIETR